MQMMILNDSDAMDVLFDTHSYAHEERLRVNRLLKTALKQDVINLRLVRLVKRIDQTFFHLWRVECLHQQVMERGETIRPELQARVAKHVTAALDSIDRDFTEASRILGMV